MGGKVLKKWGPFEPYLRPPWVHLGLSSHLQFQVSWACSVGRVGFRGCIWEACCSAAGLSASPHLYEAGPEGPMLGIPLSGAWAWPSLRVPALTFSGQVRRPSAPTGARGGSPSEGFGLGRVPGVHPFPRSVSRPREAFLLRRGSQIRGRATRNQVSQPARMQAVKSLLSPGQVARAARVGRAEAIGHLPHIPQA